MVTGEDDQKWSVDVWYPQAVQAGLRRMAVVVSNSTIATLVAKRVVSQFNKTELVTEYFEEDAAAARWLRSTVTMPSRVSSGR